MTGQKSIILTLDSGIKIECGPGDVWVRGGYVAVYNKQGEEIGYWDKAEWAEDPELVMGAIFGCAASGRKA